MILRAFNNTHARSRVQTKRIQNSDACFIFDQGLLPVEVSVFDFKVRNNVPQSFAQGLNNSNTPVFSTRATYPYAKISFPFRAVEGD
jgi:hypothetical protein